MQTIWIVEGHCGEYDDACEWPVAWCDTEETAKLLLAKCVVENASLTEEERHHIGFPTDAMIAKLTADPWWRSYYTGTHYRMYSLERWSAV